MRIFKNILPQGTGLKFFDTYLETELSKEIFDAMQAIVSEISDLTEGFVLTGGTVTGTSPNAQITESIVVLNDKILRLPATTGQTYPFYIQEATTVEIDGEFNDLVARAVIDDEAAETSSSIPGGGQYITISAAGGYKKSVPSRRIAEDNGAVFKYKKIDIGDWDVYNGGSALTGFTVAHGITNYNKIRNISIEIRNDADTERMFISVTGTPLNGSPLVIDSTNFVYTTGGASFVANDGDWDDTSYNRGWITFEYEE